MSPKREFAIAASIFLACIAGLPVLASLASAASGQAMFMPMMSALYTYLFPYTVTAAVAITAVILGIQTAVRMVRRHG